MKKIFLLILSSVSILTNLYSVSFAADVPDFAQTYNRLIDQITIGKSDMSISWTGASMMSGDMSTNINVDLWSGQKWSLKLNINYVTITNINKKWSSIEATLNIDSILNLDAIEGYTVDDLWINMTSKLIITPSMIYVQLDKFMLDTNKLPTELQGYGDMIIGYMKNGVIGKWIRIPVPKDTTKLLDSSMVNPKAIIAFLKQYPIVKSSGYANNIFTVKLDSKNILNLFATILKTKKNEYNTLSRNDIKKIDAELNKSIKWTLTDSPTPTLILTTDGVDFDGLIVDGEINIAKDKISINGNMNDEEVKASVNFSMNSTSASRYDYAMLITVSAVSDPYSFKMTMQGHENAGIILWYKLVKPKRSVTIQQLGKSIEKNMSSITE